MTEQEIEKKINELDKKLDKIPEIVSQKINETMDLKIENAIQKVKIEFYKWLVPLCITALGALVGVIFNFIK